MSLQFSIKSEKPALINLKGSLLDKLPAEELVLSISSLLEKGTRNFVLDFEEMDYINSTGLNVFISLLTKVRNAGGELILCNIPRKIEQLLLITKLNSIFNVATDLTHATSLIKNNLNTVKNNQL